MIAAACVLHNFLIEHNEMNFEFEDVLEEEQEEREMALEREQEIINNEAIVKRNRIAELYIQNRNI